MPSRLPLRHRRQRPGPTSLTQARLIREHLPLDRAQLNPR